ncbi:ABC transporter ATP-binding protein [Sinanaerobacter sp. ZZT-01]|uniref:ABC transporter ATP-binding protein n=1 Tax=Sinanaerobacter sp. ZZT-01 TaxID=3111540 RepID=UPI002D79DAB6|nr:ABC transporter ATP-binding protein [Sinanaerobacter sp. ZZT-01]WRR94934.1 ABC transporter ATP-binding protein [Sinanaerobacter sp. ZZT-01]
MKKVISGEKIIKIFGDADEKRNVLDGVSLEINEGEFVSVMGPSGSGKSTLLFALSGMDNIDSGKVFFNGKNLAELKEDRLADIRRKEMGFVFQQPTLLKNLSILDNIILPSVRDNRKNTAQIVEKARSLMKETDILKLESRSTTQVSGGQLQRAGICRALMNDPKIIFGDEPTGALNSKSAQEIMDIFSEINAKGTAVMLVSHDVKIAARTERILFMLDGKIASEIRLPKFIGVGLESRIEKITLKMQKIGI